MRFYLADLHVDDTLLDEVTRKHLDQMSDFVPMERTLAVGESDVVFLLHTYKQDFRFDSDLASFLSRERKPIVVFDYVETRMRHEPYLLGLFRNPKSLVMEHPEYAKLNEWVAADSSLMRLYFKRELHHYMPPQRVPVLPLEYPAAWGYFFETEQKIQTREEFSDRDIHLSYVWGPSTPARAVLHGEMMSHYCRHPLITDERMLEHVTWQDKVVLLQRPDYLRIPFDEMAGIFARTKIGISVWGCGQKCIRDAEVPFNCVLAMQESSHRWSYPWIDGENCIVLPSRRDGTQQVDTKEAFPKLDYYLQHVEELYRIYLQGTENWRHYRIDTYFRDYVYPEVTLALALGKAQDTPPSPLGSSATLSAPHRG